MKIILITLAFASSTLFSFLNAGYMEKMKATIKELESSQTVTGMKSTANTFERISKMEQKEWLPLYYCANIHVLLIYMDTAATLAQKDHYLDYAEQLIKRMEEISPREAEVQVLKSFLVLSRIGLSPQDRGPAMYQGYTSALEKAVQYGPENPRVKYMILAKDVGQAGYFGQDTTPFCAPMTTLLESWDTYTVVSEIHPRWGRKELQGLIAQHCK